VLRAEGKQGPGFRVQEKRENMSLTENTEAQSLGKNLKTEDRESRFQGTGAGKTGSRVQGIG
jgi:hypothetical protein